jgi:hypothetical protein
MLSKLQRSFADSGRCSYSVPAVQHHSLGSSTVPLGAVMSTPGPPPSDGPLLTISYATSTVWPTAPSTAGAVTEMSRVFFLLQNEKSA